MGLAPIQAWRNEDAPFGEIGYESTWADGKLVYTLDKDELDRFAPIIDDRMMAMYGDRYLALHPYDRWHSLFDGRMRALVNEWGPVLHNIARHAGIDITDGGDVGRKQKGVNSQFPNTALNPKDEAYASQADDLARHDHTDLGQVAGMAAFTDPDNPYKDPVQCIVEGMECMFSRLVY